MIKLTQEEGAKQGGFGLGVDRGLFLKTYSGNLLAVAALAYLYFGRFGLQVPFFLLNCVNFLQLGTYLLTAVLDPGYVSADRGGGRSCSFCGLLVGERAYHCGQCRACVEEQDHHCPWVGKCIGKGNISAFNVFLAVTSTAIISNLGVVLYMLTFD